MQIMDSLPSLYAVLPQAVQAGCVLLEYVFCGQMFFTLFTQNAPAVQAVHWNVSGFCSNPGLQLHVLSALDPGGEVELNGHAVHTTVPSCVEYVLLGQIVHTVDASALYQPCGHMSSVVMLGH